MGRPSPSFWLHRRVFVTGCTGFLGTWVVRELLARGAVVVGLIRNRPRPSDLIDDRLFERITVIRGRVEDRWRLESALAVHGIETVFHLAIPAVALANPTDPTRHLAARWARTLLTAVRRAAPAAEVVIPVPTGDATGRTQMAAAFARQAGTAVGVAVLPRLFGGGDRTWSRLVPWTLRAVLAGQPVEPPRDHELTESYLYVRDAARACLGLAESLAGDPEAWAGRATPFPATATGADLFEVLTAPYLPSPTMEDRPVSGSGFTTPSGGRKPPELSTQGAYAPRSDGYATGSGTSHRRLPTVPLLDAAAETVGWYRRFFHTPAATGTVVPARSAA